VQNSSRLALYHFWVAFGLFLPAVVLGAWQMLMRSPLPAPLDDTNAYYASVTLHGTVMAYVVTTFFAMGFGYAVTATSLGRPVRGVVAAWIGFAICLVGAVMAAVIVLLGRATVLYTFYPPLLASPWYYFGALLLIGGSMIWVVLMIYNMSAWKRDNPGQPVPLAMFAITATAILWAWAASGVEVELLFVLIPQALGMTAQIDAALGRTLFTVTLHAIVYFWLMPAYIAFYTLVPQAAGGRLYSDAAGRLTFIMFIVFSVPVGLHHLFQDPEIGSGFKFLQSFLTFFVALPTLLTVFSLCASLEIAGRARGGRGLLGWIGALPVARADDSGSGDVAGDARSRWFRRAHQYELRHGQHGSQYGVGDSAFPSDLGRRRHDHVLRDCLRNLAAHHRQAAAVQGARALAALAVVRGHHDRHHTLAYRRGDGYAAARRRLRLQRSVHCPDGSAGHHLSHRRPDRADVCDPANCHPRTLAAWRKDAHSAASLCARGEPA